MQLRERSGIGILIAVPETQILPPLFSERVQTIGIPRTAAMSHLSREASHEDLRRDPASASLLTKAGPMYRVLSVLGRQPRLVTSALAYLKDRWPEWTTVEDPVERLELMKRDWKLLVLLCEDDGELAAETLGLSAVILLLDENGQLDQSLEGEAEHRLKLGLEIDALPYFETYFLRTAETWDLMDPSI